ncbi:MAG: hypothetical protein ACRDM0_09185 [Thermoleophilaceae bacterium]
MYALRNIHRMLVPGGTLLDLQPIAPSPTVHAGGMLLGQLDQEKVWARFGKTEPGVDAAVQEGLFELGTQLEFDVIERFDSKAELVATILERDDWQMSEELAARLGSAEPPIDGHDHVRLRKFRAR